MAVSQFAEEMKVFVCTGKLSILLFHFTSKLEFHQQAKSLMTLVENYNYRRIVVMDKIQNYWVDKTMVFKILGFQGLGKNKMSLKEFQYAKKSWAASNIKLYSLYKSMKKLHLISVPAVSFSCTGCA